MNCSGDIGLVLGLAHVSGTFTISSFSYIVHIKLRIWVGMYIHTSACFDYKHLFKLSNFNALLFFILQTKFFLYSWNICHILVKQFCFKGGYFFLFLLNCKNKLHIPTKFTDKYRKRICFRRKYIHVF